MEFLPIDSGVEVSIGMLVIGVGDPTALADQEDPRPIVGDDDVKLLEQRGDHCLAGEVKAAELLESCFRARRGRPGHAGFPSRAGQNS